MKAFDRVLIASIPWVLALAYLIPAPFVALHSSEGWGYLILAMITFPAGLLFMRLDWGAHVFIYGNPVNMDHPLWYSDVYRVVTFLIFVGGGTLWFFGLGLCLRWLLRRIFRQHQNNTEIPPPEPGARHAVAGPLTPDVR